MLIWSNVRDHRYKQGQSYAPLLPPQLDVIDAPPPSDLRFVGMSMHELISAFCKSIPESSIADFSSDDDTALTSPGLRAAARSILRFDPMDFAGWYYDTEEEIADALANESGAFAGFALFQFTIEVIHAYLVMRYRKTVKITLRTDADAIEAKLPNAQIANLITVLAASLHCDESHPVEFHSARERSKKEVRLLREAACVLYRRYSVKRHDKFDLIVEGNRHFGSTRKYGITDHLLHSVARECDPKLENMPIYVRGIEAGLARNSNQLPRVAGGT